MQFYSGILQVVGPEDQQRLRTFLFPPLGGRGQSRIFTSLLRGTAVLTAKLMRHHSSLPHPFIISILFITGLLIGHPLQLFGQKHKLSKKEIRTAHIDSLFTSAEQNGLQTKGVLRYAFYFDDPIEKRLVAFAARMAIDSFEVGSLFQKEKIWHLAIYKNTRYSRETMYEQERKMRGLKYSYYIDHYNGFTISPADPDPLSMPDKEFTTYLHALSDEDLFWVGKRLLDVKEYKRARIATELGVHKQYKPDTAAYHFGVALVNTGDPDDGIVQWKKSIKLNPEYLDVFKALGKIHYENGYFDKALEYYQKADGLSPNQSDLLLKIAETYYALKKYDESYAYAVRAHQLDRKNVYTKSLLKMVKHRTNNPKP